MCVYLAMDIPKVMIMLACSTCQNLNHSDCIECSNCDTNLINKDLEIHAEIEDGVIDPIGISIIHEPIDDDYYRNLANTVCVKLACNMFDTKDTQGYFDSGLFNSAFNWMAKNYNIEIAVIATECLKNIRRIEDNKIRVDKSAQNVMAKMAISGCWASFKAEWDIRLDKITNRDAFDKELDKLATKVCEDISLNSKNYDHANFLLYFLNSIKITIEELSEKLTTAADDQYGLGCAYGRGQGINQNYEQAFAWFRKSAEQGYPPAQRKLGELYHLGQGVDKDDEQAFAWFRKSAEQGDASGQYNLSHLYSFGEGVEPDYEQAFAWINKSAEQGYARGQFRLGELYHLGQGIDKDYEQAFA